MSVDLEHGTISNSALFQSNSKLEKFSFNSCLSFSTLPSIMFAVPNAMYKASC